MFYVLFLIANIETSIKRKKGFQKITPTHIRVRITRSYNSAQSIHEHSREFPNGPSGISKSPRILLRDSKSL